MPYKNVHTRSKLAKERYARDSKFRAYRKAQAKSWAKANPERVRDLRLSRTYGMGLQEWSALLLEQEGLCAICSNVLDRGQETHVDHDHRTNKVRGLLCSGCNKSLGLMHDNATALRRAADYIEFHNKVG